MKRITLSAFIVLALITVDVTISMAYADSNITIFKVTKVLKKSKLQLRAWPSPKSRVKVSLPYNAIDLTATGKKKTLGKSKWLEVNWQNKRGWVNARYLSKTGVLPVATAKIKTQVVSSGSRNVSKSISRSVAKAKVQLISNTENNTVIEKNIPVTPNAMPQMPTENRYYQPTQIAAREVKTAFLANRGNKKTNRVLRCLGSSPRPWSIKMNVDDSKMQVNLKNGQVFNVPINYHDWASPSKVRLSFGGNKGRNIVDVNLEKTDACSTGLSRTNYLYEVNATINRDFFTGCCEAIDH